MPVQFNLHALRSEEIYTLLQKQRIFAASDTIGDYVVSTIIEQDARGCRFRTTVAYRNEVLTDPKELAPVEGDSGSSPAKEAILLYIEDARLKHADKCHKVQYRARLQQKRIGRRMILLCVAVDIVVAAILVAGYFLRLAPIRPLPAPVAASTPMALPSATATPPPTVTPTAVPTATPMAIPTATPLPAATPTLPPTPVPAKPQSAAFKLQYTAVRSQVTNDPQQGITVTLGKDDVLTITVVNPDTGEIITQEVVNLHVQR